VPEEKIERAGCYVEECWIWASRVLIFSTVTIRILANLLKNLKFTLKNPKFPTFYSETFVEKSHYYGGPIERLGE